MSASIFSFGSKVWPGISKLVEEAGEVVQVCGKLMMTGGAVDHWDGSNLKTRLEEEIADVLAACSFVSNMCGLDVDAIEKRRLLKQRLFLGWHAKGDPVPESNRALMEGTRSVNTLDLSVRSENALFEAGIRTINHLASLTPKQVKLLVGNKMNLEQIQAELQKIGRSLADGS